MPTSSSLLIPPRWPLTLGEKWVAHSLSLRVRSHLHTPASASSVWSWLIWAPRWPEWFDQAPAITYFHQASPELRATSHFHWSALGTTLTAMVVEYVPGRRLAWRAEGPGLQLYQRWQVREAATGCYLDAELVLTGWRPRLREWLRPQYTAGYLHRWVMQLHQQATQPTLPSVQLDRLISSTPATRRRSGW